MAKARLLARLARDDELRPKSAPLKMSGEEVRKELERLSENDRQYMTGYIQGLVDGRSS